MLSKQVLYDVNSNEAMLTKLLGGEVMLKTEQLSLARQMDMVFKELQEELSGLTSGTVFVQIRNNMIGKFGIRHNPLSGRSGGFTDAKKG